MRVLISGSTGFIGSALVKRLKAKGDTVVRLVRESGKTPDPEVLWNPREGTIDLAGLEGLDAIVHLAGENLGTTPWTEEKKRKIYDSRVLGTRLLCDSIAKLTQPPKVLVAASAAGYYGDRGAETLTEDSSPGSNFLAQVCIDWEQATAPAAAAGVRVVNLRIGIVMDPGGGALAAMRIPFSLGGGAVLGTGKQFVPWVSLRDILGMIEFSIENEEIHGPINGVAPNPVTNRELTKELAKALRRPALLRVPDVALRTFGRQMAEETVLASMHVLPKRLQQAGYIFEDPLLEPSLKQMLR